jgi:hypothetical protein
MPKLIRQHTFWTRESVEADAERIYLFGDNEEGHGTAGQACIRGLRNAIGIPTKKAPTFWKYDYWDDGAYRRNCRVLDEAFEKVPLDRDVVISTHGLGTGLSELPERAPLTYKYLLSKIAELERNLTES